MSKRKSKNRFPTKTPTVPAGQKEQTKVAHLTQQQFSGPVPHPQILQGYDQIIPGAAERILRMAEEDAEHQRPALLPSPSVLKKQPLLLAVLQ